MHEQFLTLFHQLDFERILDHPNILIAAAFWDEERYLAAKTCYKYMRAIDDLIDCHKSAHIRITEDQKKLFTQSVNDWIALARKPESQSQDELLITMKQFHIPIWPLEAFAKSMIYDIDHSGFPTMDSFMQYSQGATVAPASIFVHLSGLIKEGNAYLLPAFDVKEAATPCAIFSYLVHIIRDFQKDQQNHLNYFAEDLVNKHGLTLELLTHIAYGATVPRGFRDLMGEYYQLADEYRKLTYRIIEQISPLLEPRYRLSLHIIFSLYLMVFERINIEQGNFTMSELNPTPGEIKDRVYQTLLHFKE
jgi:phytoene synthase